MKTSTLIARVILLFQVMILIFPLSAASNNIPVVENQTARAEIVIDENPTRMASFAASELQTYIKKISGASLPIVKEPTAEMPTKIYVGYSKDTDKLGLETKDLADGAYRIKTGDHWIALIGRDTDFVPKEPWPKSHAENEPYWKVWDQATGSTWGNPFATNLKREFNKKRQLWAYDERGSLNAVYGFLRKLGVEWYMPGEMGEVVPKRDSISFPACDEEVRPDFGLRYHHGTAFWTDNDAAILWYLRLGLNSSSEAVGLGQSAISHGMADVHRRKEFQEAHPEYFALRAGRRVTELNQPCLSSEGLFQEHVRYVRFIFDHYDVPMVSIFPEDGAVYCGCQDCKAKATPERGWQGSQSNYVWDYVNRVAAEVYKTHPKKLVSSLAYANYVLPPTNLEKLSPNLVVGFLIYRQNHYNKTKEEETDSLIKSWREKMSPQAKIFVWSHYPFTNPGMSTYGIPVYMPQAIATSLKKLKGVSLGEFVEVAIDREKGGGLHAPIFNHLNSYISSRLYWDVGQDINQLLDRYYAGFYGPAAAPMKTFVEFCEANHASLTRDPKMTERALELFAKVKAATDPGNVYGERIALLEQFLQPLSAVKERLERGRENVPEVRIQENPQAKITIDGKLDEPDWTALNPSGGLVDIESGKPATQHTTFKFFWGVDSLYVGITCLEKNPSRLSRTVLPHDDRSIWDSDNVELLVETNSHSYYQITVSPSSGVTDLDRISGINSDWNSGAEVATFIGKGYWSVEMRIPIASPGHLDPLNNMVGTKPTPSLPWFFNIGRLVRHKDGTADLSAFSPTGKRSFGEVDRFAELYTGFTPEQLEQLERSRKAPADQ